MSASQNNLSLTINQQDSDGIDIIKRIIESVGFAGTVGEFRNGILLTTGASSLTLPTANILQFLFQNTHATAVVTIIGTKQGGTGSTLANVGPGGVFANWGATSGATEGYTALSLTPTVANTTFKMFLGG